MRELPDYRAFLATLNEVFPDKGALNLKEAANYLNLDSRLLAIEIRAKRMPGQQVRRRFVIPIPALAAWMAQTSNTK